MPKLLERFVESISPSWAARREQSRTRLGLMRSIQNLNGNEEFKGYRGAKRERPYTNWLPDTASPDEDILPDLDDMRGRSRDLIRNDPHAAGLVEVWTSNVIGNGLTPQSRIDREMIGLTEEQATRFERGAERAWRRFARQSDYTGQMSEVERQALTFRQIFENGDVFLLPRRMNDPRRPYSVAIEVIEADRVTTPFSKMSRTEYREGVEVDQSTGAPIAYWIKKTHPGGSSGQVNDFVRIPATGQQGRRQVFHLYRVLRPGQSRGVPWLAPALGTFKDISQYFKAELIAAKVAACQGVFVTTDDPLGDALKARSNTSKPDETVSPGLLRYLEPGQSVQDFSPNRPNPEFDPFILRALRSAGASIQTPYELTSQDFSQTTYTSGRMALTEIRRNFRGFHRWFAQKAVQPFYDLVIEEAVLKGDIEAPRFFENQEEYLRVNWVGTGWTWVDPQREVAATIDSINNCMSTIADELAARGLDWEDVMEQRAREVRRLEELGLDEIVLKRKVTSEAVADDDEE